MDPLWGKTEFINLFFVMMATFLWKHKFFTNCIVLIGLFDDFELLLMIFILYLAMWFP